MRPTLRTPFILTALLAGHALTAAGQTTDPSLPLSTAPLYQRWVVSRMNLIVAGGRITNANGAWMHGDSLQEHADGSTQEKVTVSGNGVTGSIVYSFRRKGEGSLREAVVFEFVLEVNSENRFLLRSHDRARPENYFELNQVPGQPVALALSRPEKPRIVQAPTLWHLLILYPDDCRKSLLPALETIRSDWALGQAVRNIEEELVKLASVSRNTDRKQWAAWVDQLGHPLWTRREAADRSLRDVGPAALGYLTRIDLRRLDAEQQLRVRRIIRALSIQAGEDTPEHAAAMLMEDPLIWLALSARAEESVRQAAVQQLGVILNAPVGIDPKADPGSQAKVRDELRSKIEKLSAESSGADRGRKPAGGDPGSPADPR